MHNVCCPTAAPNLTINAKRITPCLPTVPTLKNTKAASYCRRGAGSDSSSKLLSLHNRKQQVGWQLKQVQPGAAGTRLQ